MEDLHRLSRKGEQPDEVLTKVVERVSKWDPEIVERVPQLAGLILAGARADGEEKVERVLGIARSLLGIGDD